MKPNIYVSIPLALDLEEPKKVLHKLSNDDYYKSNLCYWKRGSNYDRDSVRRCDIFIFMTTNNEWSFNSNTLPVGVLKELTQAQILNKPIYMAYKNKEGNYNFYKIFTANASIMGVPGSTAEIWKEIESFIPIEDRDSVFVNDKVSELKYLVVNPLSKYLRVDPLTPREYMEYDPRLLL